MLSTTPIRHLRNAPTAPIVHSFAEAPAPHQEGALTAAWEGTGGWAQQLNIPAQPSNADLGHDEAASVADSTFSFNLGQ